MTDTFRALCAEQLPALRGMFERILCVARSSGGPTVGNIQLADRLIDAVMNWSATARAALAQPEPVGPTDQEIADTFAQGCVDGVTDPDQPPYLAGAKAVLARWGQRAPQPIPVSERLPGPENCDAEGCCWWWCTDGPTPGWILCTAAEGWTRWLPYHDLPLLKE